MSLLKYIFRLKRMDDLIRRKATGTPDEFANKLEISKSLLMINLNEMKEMGAPIQYDMHQKTYYYTQKCRLNLEFELGEEEGRMIKGGRNILGISPHSNIIRMGLANFELQGL